MSTPIGPRGTSESFKRRVEALKLKGKTDLQARRIVASLNNNSKRKK